MPILPTYQGVNTSIATQRTQEAPLDTSGRDINKLGQATENLGNTLTHVMQKRQALEDEAMAMQRLIQAKSDMNDMHDSFSKNEIGREARDVYSKTVDERRKDWFKGLTPGASAKLDQHLGPVLIEHRSAAYKVENRVRLNDYQAGGNAAMKDFIESASRLTDSADGKDTKEYAVLKKYFDTGEANGYYTKEESEKALDQALIAGSTSRVLKVANSTDRAELENILKVYNEEGIQGGTFLQHIPTAKRQELKHTIQSRIEHLDSEEVRKKNQAYTDTQRNLKELQDSTSTLAVQKMRDPAKYGPITHEWLDLAGETGLIEGKDLSSWHDRVEGVARGGAMTSGGYGDSTLINRLELSSQTFKTRAEAVSIQNEAIAAVRDGRLPVGPNSPGDRILNRLDNAVRGPMDEQLTPGKQLIFAKQEVDAGLDVAGPMASPDLKAKIGGIKEEAYALLHKNAEDGYPKTSREVIEENMPRWKARAGEPARFAANEQRKNLGLERGALTPERRIESAREKAIALTQEHAAAPPGPEGQGQRDAIEARLAALKRLVDLEREMIAYGADKDMSNAATNSGGSKPTNKPGAPLQGPRGNK